MVKVSSLDPDTSPTVDDLLMMVNNPGGSPGSRKITISDLITLIINTISPAWSSYTPTWAASGTAVSLGNGILNGHYLQIGKLVAFRITLTMGSTTTFGTGAYEFLLPIAPLPDEFITNYAAVGTWSAFDTSAASYYGGVASIIGTQKVTGTNASTVTSAAQASQIGNSLPFTFANGDILKLRGMYEVA